MNFLYRSVICLFLIFTVTSCESRKTIVNNLDEKEANEIVVFLATRGIDANKTLVESGAGGGTKTITFDISVTQTESTEAMSLLNQNGLPRRRGQNLLGIFTNTGLVPSEMQDKIRYQAGLAEQIASTIRKIDGVLDAEVQISFPKEDPLNPDKPNKDKITASVFIKHSGVLDDPNNFLITKIRRLVAASITGLDFDNVTVITDRARFSDSPIGVVQGGLDETRPYVGVWSIIIAQESLFRFRILFFGFIFLIILLILALIWTLWKTHPLLKPYGGLKELLTLHAIGEHPIAPETEEEKKEEKPVENKDEQANKDVDET